MSCDACGGRKWVPYAEGTDLEAPCRKCNPHASGVRPRPSADVVTQLDIQQKTRATVQRLFREGAVSPDEAAVLRNLGYGHKEAKTAGQLAGAMGLPADETSRRRITQTVERLRERHKLPIGACRKGQKGYFFMVSRKDLEIGTEQSRKGLRTQFQNLAAYAGKHFAAEVCGQIIAELRQ